MACGKAIVIDFFGTSAAASIAERLRGEGFEVNVDIRNIQGGPSCGYNAASIIARVNSSIRFGDHSSWFDQFDYSTSVYTASRRGMSNLQRNIIVQANNALGRTGNRAPLWLKAGEVVKLIPFFCRFFGWESFQKDRLLPSDLFDNIRDPMSNLGFSLFISTIKKNIVKKPKDVDTFNLCVVNTADGTGNYWFVVCIQVFKSLDCTVEHDVVDKVVSAIHKRL